MNLEHIIRQACMVVLETGKYIKGESLKLNDITIEIKDLNSLVSYVDKHAETRLVEGLTTIIPDSGLLTEEDTVNISGKTWEWIIDPLDGTTNFLYGLPVYAISIGLRRDGELVGGIVYEINNNELFHAWKDGGAWMNKTRVYTSKRTRLSESLIATGFPYYDFSRMDDYWKAMSYFAKNTRSLRRLGSAAVDLAYVSCGRFDGFFEYSLKPWDVAAGSLLILEAGGRVTDFSGGDNFLFGGEMVAANQQVYKTFYKKLHDIFEGEETS